MTRDQLIARTQAARTQLPPPDNRVVQAAIAHTLDWLQVYADSGRYSALVRYAALPDEILTALREWAGANNLTIVEVAGKDIFFSWEPRSGASAAAATVRP